MGGLIQQPPTDKGAFASGRSEKSQFADFDFIGLLNFLFRVRHPCAIKRYSALFNQTAYFGIRLFGHA
jgi:hypothetical protein